LVQDGYVVNPLNEAIKSAGGDSFPTLGWVNVRMKLPGKEFVHPVVIAESLAQSCLLGSDIMDWYWLDSPCLHFLFHKPQKGVPSVNLILGQTVMERVQSACLDESQKEKMMETFEKFPEVLCEEPGRTSMLEHHIETGSHAPVSSPPYRMSPLKLEALDKVLEDMLRRGQIVPTQGPWASPAFLRPKSDGGWRLCINYQKLNDITIRDKYPLPRMDELIDIIGQPRFITSLDLRSGYWQVPLDAESQDKAAFICSRGLFKPRVLMFGLHNSPASFQRLINHLMLDLQAEGVVAYIDDLIIASQDFDTHVKTLTKVLDRLKKAGLTVNTDKVQVCQPETKVLGVILSAKGVQVDPSKVEAVRNMSPPTTVKQVRQFLGLTSWYRRFIKGYAHVAAPLNRLLDSGRAWEWTGDCENAFRMLRESVCSAPIVQAPDFQHPFIVHTDASGVGVGAVLLQERKGNPGLVTIQYASRALSKAEMKYSAVERELLAVVWALEKFRPYLEVGRFTVYSDQKSLQWIRTAKDPTGRLARWIMRLQPYDFALVYHPGKGNLVADALSRSPEFDQVESVISALVRDVVVPSLDEICTAQKSDPELGPLYQVVSSGEEPPPGKAGVKMRRSLQGVEMRQQVLGRLILDETTGERFCILVPKVLRVRMLAVYHDSLMGGHLGAWKTKKKLQQAYTWKGMTRDVATYVRSCHKCQQFKADNQLPKGLMGQGNALPQPWETVCIDLAGPYPRAKSGCTHMLVVTDVLTKWTELFAIRRATALAVAKILVREVFPRYGAPKVLLSDNGRQFVSRVLKWVCRLYGVKQAFTSLYHPQPNQAERVIRTAKSMMAMSIRESHREWDENLPHIAMALRTATSESTGYTPAFLMFGRQMRLPVDPVEGGGPPPEDAEEQWAVEVVRRTRKAIQRAQLMINQQHVRNKVAYDARHRDVSFQVGQQVLRRSHVLSDAVKGVTSKFAPKWQGPYLVSRVQTPLTYKLWDVNLDQELQGTYHVSDLKVYHDSVERGAIGDLFPVLDVDGSGEPTRLLRPRGVAQSKLNQAVQDLLRGRRRSEGTSLVVGGNL
jgi:transposase InsO family protein